MVGVGVKEVIELPDNLIEARFNLQENEGAARVTIGCTEGISGGGFLYTNQGSISLGIVFNPEQAARNGKRVQEIMQDFKLHPAIAPLIAGGTTIEYGAHLVPELGLSGLPKRLYRDGMLVVGDAAGFGINTGMIIRGIDLAILSGVAAANSIIKAGDLAEIGQRYMQELEILKLLPNQRVFAGWHRIFEISGIFSAYPNLANEAMKFMFTVDGEVPEKMHKGVYNIMKRHVTLRQLIADVWKGGRAI